MKTSEIGIIGGSGIYNMENVEIINEHSIDTPFGDPSSKIVEAKFDEVTFFFLPRHGINHSILPSEVNYRANIFALKKMGVRYLISVSAVGSLEEDCPPSSFVLPDQFIDWTKGKRERTFFGNGIIGHVSVANPICKKLQQHLGKACSDLDIKYKLNGSYICIDGPQFSTKAESTIYRSFGARVIGMTNVPESYLAKEAGISYATVAMVTDYDCWKEEHCNVNEILKIMKGNNEKAQALIKSVISSLSMDRFKVETENEVGIMTPYNQLSEKSKEIVDVLVL